jgi:ABC-type antimicrobial peptide transport system permease subunit
LQRTRELAVRAALGATPNGLRAMIVGDGLRLALLGTVLGTVGAVGGMHVVRQFLPTVGTFDVAAAGVALLVLIAAMLVASYLPAHRAAKLNPVDALRCD